MPGRDPRPADRIGDADNPEWTKADFRRARPADRVHGEAVAARLVRRGRPPLADGERKEPVSIRLSAEVLDFFRAGGRGWQTRIDEVLREHIGTLRGAKGRE